MREHEQLVDDLRNELRAATMTAEMASAKADEQLEAAAFLSGTVEELQAALAHAQEESKDLRMEVSVLQQRRDGVITRPAEDELANNQLPSKRTKLAGATGQAPALLADMLRRMEVCEGGVFFLQSRFSFSA